jgi:hypothetical protein
VALEAVGESAFDKLHCLFEGDFGRRRKEKMKMVRHDDEGVKLIAVLSAVMSECFEKEVCGVFDLKESTTIGGDGRGEVCAELLRRRERHLERIKDRGKVRG